MCERLCLFVSWDVPLRTLWESRRVLIRPLLRPVWRRPELDLKVERTLPGRGWRAGASLKPAQLTALSFPGLRALFFGGVDRTPAVCQVPGAPSGSHQ